MSYTNVRIPILVTMFRVKPEPVSFFPNIVSAVAYCMMNVKETSSRHMQNTKRARKEGVMMDLQARLVDAK